MIEFFFDGVQEFEISPDITNWLLNVITAENLKTGKVTYIFCDDEYLLQINRDFLAHDYYTDIITFDYRKGNIVSGDIFVSLPRIAENAVIHQSTWQQEFCRVLVHGILHVCGYKDKTPTEAAMMRQKENQVLLLFSNYS